MQLQTMPLRFRVWNDIEKCWGAIPSHYISIGLDLLYGDANQEDSRYIISQDTGLKDENNADLFTGDIVEIDKEIVEIFGMEKSVGMISYHRAGLMVTDQNGDWYGRSNLNALANIDGVLRGKKLGTIWQNPELLEKKQS